MTCIMQNDVHIEFFHKIHYGMDNELTCHCELYMNCIIYCIIEPNDETNNIYNEMHNGLNNVLHDNLHNNFA